jgi:acetyl-CoA acetyltransferase
VRTLIGRYGGTLKDVRPDDMGALVISEAIKRANIDPGSIERYFRLRQPGGRG